MEPEPVDPVYVSGQVPFEFTATLRTTAAAERDEAALLRTVERVWEEYLLARLRKSLGEDRPDLRALDVDLFLTAERHRRRRGRQRRRRLDRRRRLQGTTTTYDVAASGTASLIVDEVVYEPEEVDLIVGQALAEALTTDNLQRALDDAVGAGGGGGGGAAVVVSGVSSEIGTPDRSSADEDSDGPPGTARIVFGFLLLALVLASLAFWAALFWKKRRKKLEKRRLADLRKSQSVVIGGSSYPRQQQQSFAASGSGSVPPILPVESESSSDSSYHGIDSGSTDSDAAASDPFGRELRNAASLDRAAWEEFRRKKLTAEREGRVLSQQSSPAVTGGVAYYDAPGSQEAGIEVDPVGFGSSFPYGDEPDETVTALTSDDAVRWTAAGVAIEGIDREAEDTGDFEPYGDSRSRPTLQESWDMDEILTNDEPATYSFMYPLKKQTISTDSPTASDPTSAAVRSASEVTSIGTTVGVPAAAAAADEKNEVNDDSESRVTESQIREVENIAHFLQQYERRRSAQLSMKRELERSGRAAVESASSNPGIQYDATSDSAGAKRNTGYRSVDSGRTAQPAVPVPLKNAARSDESSVESELDDDDDVSLRLGISPYKVQIPPSPRLSYKVVSSIDSPDQAAGPSFSASGNSETATDSQRLISSLTETESPRQPLSPEPIPGALRGSSSDNTAHPDTVELVLTDEEGPFRKSDKPKKKDISDITESTSSKSLQKQRKSRRRDPEQQSAASASEKSSTAPFDEAGKSLPKPRKNRRRDPEQQSAASASEKSSTAPFDEAGKSLPKPRRDRRRDSEKQSAASASEKSSTAPFDEAGDDKEGRRPSPPTQAAKLKKNFLLGRPMTGVSPRTRSKNKNFNNILSIFESKPKTPIVPPSETVR
jgi:hypothetical protein